MKIGKLVKHHIKRIFQYCQTNDCSELDHLTDKTYSKDTFGINYPFCTEVCLISKEDSKRYWLDEYSVQGKKFRVSSQWFSNSKEKFITYIINKNIVIKNIVIKNEIPLLEKKKQVQDTKIKSKNRRYKNSAIGNSQNLLIRNILSNLGQESFGKDDWEKTKNYFSNKCAYCGKSSDLVIDHAVPINKTSLGEHRLGNLIPSCKLCNSKKSNKNYYDFLSGQPKKINKIEQYMERKNYIPLGNNKKIAMILEMAYQEVSLASERYIAILNEKLPNKIEK